ncbi:MAG: YcjX family protein [Dichotomicrobium sp.]
MSLTDVSGRTTDTLRNAGSLAGDLLRPTLRLGVTGLSRAGKTVFITSLVHNLLHGGRLPFFDAMAQGRIERVYLEPQPDDDVPRFAYEDHLTAMTGPDPHWPESTRHISQLRVTIEFEPLNFLRRQLGTGRLHVDIVDYPGEWLLDLALLETSYADWSRLALEMAERPERAQAGEAFRAFLPRLDPAAPQDERLAREGAQVFTAYLHACRDGPHGLVATPGRFLLPGAFEGTPAVTFCPLPVSDGPKPGRGTMWAMMERRFESYKSAVVRPFFRDHFARLDRQIVLVDVLSALGGGPEAIAEMERALARILDCFNPGAKSWLELVLGRRIDRVLFAATKADHVHSESHDRLEAVLRHMVRAASGRAETAGAQVDAVALAAVRATREAQAAHNGDQLPTVVGRPEAGEVVGGERFDGAREAAIFPGDLPEDPAAVLAPDFALGNAAGGDFRFVRFRPPEVPRKPFGGQAPLPHIRLDRALNFLIGDRIE